MKLTVTEQYGPLKPGKTYEVLEEGYDCVKVSVKGKPFWAFNWVFEGEYEEEENEFDD